MTRRSPTVACIATPSDGYSVRRAVRAGKCFLRSGSPGRVAELGQTSHFCPTAQRTARFTMDASSARAADLPRFPRGFRWGAATAAFQIEGSTTADGRGPS
ncbi:MAG TPA: family 1 glycosylhydrolase, partial [Agromyces sp.]